MTEVGPTIALLEGGVWPDHHLDAVEIGKQSLEDAERDLSMGARVYRDTKDKKVFGLTPAAAAQSVAAVYGIKDSKALAYITEKIQAVVKNAANRKPPVKISPAEAAGLLTNATKPENLYNLENIQDGLDITDADLTAWAGTQQTARADYEGFEKLKTQVDSLTQLSDQYTAAMGDAKRARAKAMTTSEPSAGRNFIKAMGKLYRISEQMGGNIEHAMKVQKANQQAQDELYRAGVEAGRKQAEEEARKRAGIPEPGSADAVSAALRGNLTSPASDSTLNFQTPTEQSIQSLGLKDVAPHTLQQGY